MKTIMITFVLTVIILVIALNYQKKPGKPIENKTAEPIYDIINGVPSNQIQRPGWSIQYPNIFVGIGNENASIGWNIVGQPIIGGNPNMVS